MRFPNKIRIFSITVSVNIFYLQNNFHYLSFEKKSWQREQFWPKRPVCRSSHFFLKKQWRFSQNWNAAFQSCYQFSQHMGMLNVGVASSHRNSIVEKVWKKHTVIDLSWNKGSTFFEQTAEVFTLSSQSKTWKCKASCRKKRVPGTFPTSETLKAEMARKMKKFLFLENQTFCCSKPLSTFVHQSINRRFVYHWKLRTSEHRN